MKNKSLIILVFILGLIGIGAFFIFNNTNKQAPKTAQYSVNRTKSTVNENKSNLESNNILITNVTTNNTTKTKPIEKQIAKFTTKIYTKDSGRQNNIRITCSTLNNTLVKNGETFSFCNTVGKATTSKGYEKADVFDSKR